MRIASPGVSRAALIGLAVLLLLGGRARAEGAPRWIVVTAPAFEAAVEPLCKHRAAQGYDVVRVRVKDVAQTAVESADVAEALRADLVRRCTAKGGSACSVLLVGAAQASPSAVGPAPAFVLPALVGTVGRMRGQPTDLRYGDVDGDGVPDIPVGRFPARSVAEAKAMVQKTIAFEQHSMPPRWSRQITLLVGHPGGSSAFERKIAGNIVTRAVATGLAKLNPGWRTRALIHIDDSPFTVPDDALRGMSLAYLRAGQLLSIYLGHSGTSGLTSRGTPFLTRADFANTDFGPGAGILLTCGCWACHLDGPRGEGYGLAAMRNPRGPVAVVGAHGASYGAMGKLAFEGLLPILASAEPPRRLGDWWRAVQDGLVRGSITPFAFMLYDRADGSRGKVPLAVQRREHLEMWTLQGDPALRLPAGPAAWPGVTLSGQATPGASLTLDVALPEGFDPAATTVRITVERPFGVEPPGLPALPTKAGPARDAALRRRHAASNDVVLATQDASVVGGRARAGIALPATLPGEVLHVRVQARAGKRVAEALRVLPIAR